jgi:periplasmic divalent cation tolerance protein
MTPYCLVLITTPKSAAKKVTEALLKKRLAACVNILAAVSSHYWWKGKIERGAESLLVVKTRKNLFQKLAAEVTKVHPYEVPEIISVPLLAGNKPYLKWIADETGR